MFWDFFYLRGMMTSEIQLPDPIPFYKTYIDVLGEVNLDDMLKRQLKNFPEFIESIPDISYAYAEGKWSIAGVLLHILDAERVFQYRALRFSRGDKTALPGFDQDLFVSNSNYGSRSKKSLIQEYKAVRNATITLFSGFSRPVLDLKGTASGLEWSVATLGFVICGHQKHHRNILRQRYI
tara:strand:+ start:174806 stop:175345 length:540 start_codon:yes stop_codon:yes gene_type:complete